MAVDIAKPSWNLRTLLPPVIADLLERHERRRADRRETWRQHNTQARRRAAAYERIVESRDRTRTTERDRSFGADGLEL